jgi:hypothetical protein
MIPASVLQHFIVLFEIILQRHGKTEFKLLGSDCFGSTLQSKLQGGRGQKSEHKCVGTWHQAVERYFMYIFVYVYK